MIFYINSIETFIDESDNLEFQEGIKNILKYNNISKF